MALWAGVAGCTTSGDPTPTMHSSASAHTVWVSSTALHARLAVGHTLAVEFGAINYSIGQQWRVLDDPDPTILQPLLTDQSPVPDTEPSVPGTATTLTMRFTAIAPGTTTLTTQYWYRGAPANPGDRSPATRTLTVRVT